MHSINSHIALRDHINIEATTNLKKLSSHNVCNPSVIFHNDRILAVYKGINYDLKNSDYKAMYAGFLVPFSDSQNYVVEVDDSLTPIEYAFIEDRHIRGHAFAWQGIQDLRIFTFNDKILCMGTAISHEAQMPKSGSVRVERMLIAELQGTILEPIAILPSRQQREKNWMPWVKGQTLYAIYSQDPYEIIGFSDWQVSHGIFPNSNIKLKEQSGGTCVIPYRDKYIAVIHRKSIETNTNNVSGSKQMRYTHSFVVYSQDFDVLAVSDPFRSCGQTGSSTGLLRAARTRGSWTRACRSGSPRGVSA